MKSRDEKYDQAFSTVMQSIRIESESNYAEVARDTKLGGGVIKRHHEKAPKGVHIVRNILGYYGDDIGEFFNKVEAEYRNIK